MTFLIASIFLLTILNQSVLCVDVNPIERLDTEAGIGVTELIRNVKKLGEIDIDIAIPDPLEFNGVELSVPGEIFSANVSISKGSLSGLSDVRILDINLSTTEPTIGFNILIPVLKLHTDYYELDGNIYYAVPIKGKGVAHFEIYNMKFWGTLHLKPSFNSILLDKLEDGDFSIERIVSNTEFDHNIDDIISALIEDLLANYLNRFSKYITATYSDTVIEYINDVLQMLGNKV
ncbi:uncharacterized protein LOC142986251 [Anticarsia gemmatalis]|uniref:uncharacterized protein LOC142986251 n=1 Tax=Anticarsia gemmatalis TaxID=129554 RepID=UPI003F766746